MAVALSRLFYMMQGINPMTDSTKPRTLKDQLESETADTERSAAVDSERYHGGDWWQLTNAEESVFVIDRERFPRMITVWSCYEAFKNIAYSLSWEDGLIEQACQQHPDWCSETTIASLGTPAAFRRAQEWMRMLPTSHEDDLRFHASFCVTIRHVADSRLHLLRPKLMTS
jgi:hypothetical protein